MLSTIAALLLTCKMPYRPPTPPPPPITIRCEGADQVRRNHDGLEVSRVVNACTVVRCEGTDRVRRTYEGRQVAREFEACIVSSTTCEGAYLVRRTVDGRVLSSWFSPERCVQPVVVTPPPPQNDPLRYGLSYR